MRLLSNTYNPRWSVVAERDLAEQFLVTPFARVVWLAGWPLSDSVQMFLAAPSEAGGMQSLYNVDEIGPLVETVYNLIEENHGKAEEVVAA